MKTLDEVITIMDGIDQTCTCCAYQHDCDETECVEKTALYYLKDLKNLQEDYDILYDKNWREYNQQQANPALTWDELKQMEGKPVWIDSVPIVRRWVIIKKFHPIGGNKNLFDMEVEDGAHFLRKNMRRDDPAWWQAYRKERK